MYLYSLKTGITKEIKTDDYYHDIQLTPEGDKIVLSNYDSFLEMDIHDPEVYIENQTHRFELVAPLGGGRIYTRGRVVGDNAEKIYDLKNMAQAESQFAHDRKLGTIISSTVDLEGGRVFFSVNIGGTHNVLEVWNKVELD
ncbi:hypothetical protein D3C72_1891330 [compost metagenome]